MPGTAERGILQVAYRDYARAATTGRPLTAEEFSGAEFCEPPMLDLYASRYLPHEILRWGGDLRHMFPITYGLLEEAGLPLDAFLHYWFREPRPTREPYDFFLLKIDRFVAFVNEVLPTAGDFVNQEAADLRVGYQVACDGWGPSSTVGQPSP